ncbi:MAG: hypothetical protein RI955_1183, partial [Bacteroidota bacterium]
PDTYIIGTTLTTNNTISSPIAAIPSLPKSRAQYLFSASELKSYGMSVGAIKGLGFTVTTKNSSTALHDFSIKLACVNYSSFSKTSPYTFDTLSKKYLVYNKNFYSTTLGLNQFVFDTTFAWNGTSNLLVEICYDNTGFTTAGLSSDAVKRTVMPVGNANSVYGIANIAEPNAACSQSFPTGSTHSITASNARPQFNFLACNGSYIPTGTTYSWTSSPSGFTSTLDSVFVTPTSTTTYYVVASNFGCTHNDSLKVAVFNTTLKAGNDTTLCFVGTQKTVTLSSTATGAGPFNYLWTVKPSSAFISASEKTKANPIVTVQANTIDTFVVSMTSATCTLHDTMIVYASAKPTITKTKDSLVCMYDTIQLSLSSNQLNTTYSWTSNHDALSCYNCYNPTSIITQNDTFNFVATNAYGCTTLEKVRVSPKPIPTGTFTATSPVCPNANSTLTYTGNVGNGATYNWNFAGGIATPGGVLQGPQSVHWAVSDTYNIVLSVTKNKCTSLKDTQSVIVLPIPTSTFTTNNAHCVGDTLVLTYTGNGASIPAADPLWVIPASATIVSGSIVSFGPITLIPAVGSSIYSLTVNNGNCSGIAFKDTIVITANPTSTFSVTSPICLNSKSTISYTGSANNNSKFNWNFDAGTSTINDTLVGPHAVQWTSVGTKNVSLWVNEKGCISDTTIHAIQVLQTPAASFSVNAAHCVGDTIELIYTGNGKTISGSVASWNISPNPTYLVGNATTFDTIKFVPSVGNTIINLIVSNGTCADTLKDTISIYSIPDNQFTIDSLVCMNANTTINYTGLASVSATYNWNFDGAIATPGGIVKGPHTVNWASIGTKNISLSVTENGCTSAIDTQQIRVLQLPTSSFTTNNAHCIGDTLQLIYTGNAKSISGSIAAWNITPTPTFILGDTTTMDTILFVPAVGNTIIGLTISNKICSVVSKDTISIFNYPTNTFTATSPVCPNQNSTINYTGNATLGATYNWNYDGGTTGVGTVKWSTSGTYHISLSVSQNGCTSAIDTMPVAVLQIPTASFTKSTAHCIGDTITLIYTGDAKTIVGANLKWIINPTPTFLIGDTTTMDTLQFVPTIGNTIVQLIASNSTCSSSFFDTTIIYQYPTNTFTLSNDTACNPSTSVVTYTGSASVSAIYNWNFNSLSTAPGGTTKGPHTITIPNAGDYNISLFVTENGCTSDTSNHAIKVYQSPAISLLKNNPHCKGDTLTLNYSSPSVAFPTWIIPASATLLSGSLTGNTALTVLLDTGMNHFSVNITDGICTSTANDSIRIYKIPTSTFTINPTTNCTALASTLTYTGNASNAATYNWNFASGTATPGGTTKNQSVVWNTAGNYNVVLSVSENGCTSVLDTQAVSVLLSPTSIFTKNNPHCAGDTLTLTYSGNAALVVGATALWNIPSGATLVNGSLNSFSPIQVILPTGMNHFGLTITNSICTSTSNDSIRIYQIPTSTFTINPTTNCTALASTLTYTGNASNAATYNWNFASGTATPGGTTKNQ